MKEKLLNEKSYKQEYIKKQKEKENKKGGKRKDFHKNE